MGLELRNLTLNFDGACWPNPGGIPTYGWHIDSEEGRIADGTGRIPNLPPHECSNNSAEWGGLRAGLRWLACLRIPIDLLILRGDSQLILRQLDGQTRAKKPHLARFRDECRTLLRSIDAGHVETAWVPRAQNRIADALSKAV